jgi:hypothetical protein
MNETDRGPTPRARLLAAGLALLLVSTFFLLGDTGQYSDDYYFVQRDPATGEIRSLVLDRPIHVWRPLFRVVSPALQTLAADHLWTLHALASLLHGGACVLLYGLLRRLGAGWRVSAAGAGSFMVCVAQYEAVLWLSCLPTLLAINLVLALMHAHLWFVGRARTPTPVGRGWAWVVPLAMLPGAWAAGALNEQPAGLLGVLPLLGLLSARGASVGRLEHACRSIVPGVLAGVGLAVYMAGHAQAGFGTPGARGASTAVVAMFERAARLAGQWPASIVPVEIMRGAMLQAARTMGEHPVRAGLAFAALIVSMIVLGRAWTRRDEPSTTPDGAGWRLIVLGLAAFLPAWGPIMLVHGRVLSRLHYPPGVGLAIAMAGVLIVIGRALPGAARGPARAVGYAALAAVLVLQCAAWVGLQGAYQARWRLDVGEARQLREVFGDVPPGTVFVPVRATTLSTSTGVPAFDRLLRPAWHWPYAAGTNLQREYRRDDVFTIVSGFARQTGVWAAPGRETTHALIRNVPAAPRTYQPGEVEAGEVGRGWGVFPWATLAPFVIDGGRVTPVTRVIVRDAAGGGRVVAEFVPPVAKGRGLVEGATVMVGPAPVVPAAGLSPAVPAR